MVTESLFRVPTGFTIDDNINIIYGVAAPTTGVVAPVGSVYMQNAAGTDGGALWVKYGEADTAWRNTSNPVGIKWLNSVKATTADDVSTKFGTAQTFTDDEIGITLTLGDRIASKFDDKIYVVTAATLQAITGVNQGLKQFTIAGDHQYPAGTKIIVSGSTGNDGTYTVVTAVYGTSTVITVAEVIDDPTVDGSLKECWEIASDGNLTAQDAFFSEYTFIFSADAALQGPSAVLYDGSDLIKLASFDFEYATTIKLSAGYSPANGSPAAGDSVEKAIGNLDANAADMQTAMGISQGAVNLGTWTTAAYLTDNTETVKSALNKLNTGLDKARHEAAAGPITGTPVVVDSMNVDSFHMAHWLVVCYETANPDKKIGEEVIAIHDGTVSADAVDVDYTKYGKIKTTPSITGLSVTVALAGSGITQTMDLVVSSTTSVMVKAIRVAV